MKKQRAWFTPTKASRSRREFLKSMAAASVYGSGLGAVNGKLGMMGTALASSGDAPTFTDYKALVCVFLYGGSDSFNMFVPTDDALFQQYETSRGGLSVPRDSLLLPTAGAPIGFNQYMPGCKSLYDAGQLAVVSNVGNIIEPNVIKQDYVEGSSKVPVDLFAHNHQQEQWLKGNSSLASTLVSSGWGGRIGDLLQDPTLSGNADKLPPTFSLFGSNHWLPGDKNTPLSVHRLNGLEPIEYMDVDNYYDESRAAALRQILSQTYDNTLHQQVADTSLSSVNRADLLISKMESAPDVALPIGREATHLDEQLNMVARLIQSQAELDMPRQIFFVGMGGWDTHDNQGVRLNALLSELDNSLSYFQSTLAGLGKSDAVTTFTASDFGRTLSVNGDGSDHGWGGHYMVMGGAVDGGKLYGDLPSFVTGADDDADDKGRVIPKISVNQMGGALGRWMGLSNSEVLDVFPDLANFNTSSDALESWQDSVRLFG